MSTRDKHRFPLSVTATREKKLEQTSQSARLFVLLTVDFFLLMNYKYQPQLPADLEETVELFNTITPFLLAIFCFFSACTIRPAHADPAPSEPRVETRGGLPTITNAPNGQPTPAAVQIPATALPNELAPWREPSYTQTREYLTHCINPGPELDDTVGIAACGDALNRLAAYYQATATWQKTWKAAEQSNPTPRRSIDLPAFPSPFNTEDDH
ncbi:MAG: hypothetical protein UW63_C0043G0021 [Candidatus Uhrbacteria bacterium GW2011_GWF2_44_350]|uniref:Uncharacterized protein n=1 Tax=Candidatus Uhrbacteria bacterium GW2011_GWF2_44_350 TaxID=1619000 RepID=A0A0G1JE17_9BACT|nr:MAG: hypothetical protein UW63_C0043G0021 [Candidatus Uhrbacteria bacterium GW2011_GWF2_44_350]HBR80642.1 hypothetical protein [Candidatus Uhrbacteria bacterium]HCU32194.1 hypothetical protein [Candidatus Uhrbacteria bacterium]